MRKYYIILILLSTFNYGRDVDRIVLQQGGTMTTAFYQLYFDKALNEDWALRTGYSGGRASSGYNQDWDGIELGFSYEMSDTSNDIFHSYFSLGAIAAYGYGGNTPSDFYPSVFFNFDFRWDISDVDAIGIGGFPGAMVSFCYERRL